MARTQIDKSLIGTVNSSSLVGTTTNDSAASYRFPEPVKGELIAPDSSACE